MDQGKKLGLIVILAPALGVAIFSLVIARSAPRASGISAWQRVAPLVTAWAIGLVLVVMGYFVVRWAAARGRRVEKDL